MGRPRDFLGRAFFVIHILVVLYTLTGWAYPAGLVFYVFFIPLMVLHWPLNRGSCVLNNLENWLREGRWRNPSNREEGAWVHCLVVDTTGLALSPRQVMVLSYGLLALCWILGLLRLTGLLVLWPVGAWARLIFLVPP